MKHWEEHVKTIRTLAGRLGFEHEHLEFLGYALELESGQVYDKLKDVQIKNPRSLYILYTLLAHYSKGKPTQRVEKLIKYRELPGGIAYEGAFVQRAVSPITKIFGTKPEMLVEAARLINGIQVEYGDASTEIPALPKIPLSYILWEATDEFPSSATILFDASASHYLHTEDLAVLAELTTKRLEHSLNILESNKNR
ncbi:MAG: DUF3786 domain-containing protein [Candidatus Hermodarchaeota archaeon]